MRFVLLLAAITAATAEGQQPEETDRGPLNRHLPQWLTLGTHNVARYEARRAHEFDSSQNDAYLQSRLRLQAGIQPSNRFRVFLEAQDSRDAWTDAALSLPNATNHFDLRQAYVVIGDEKDGWWDISAGRQELAFGRERLIGVNRWSNVARSFDAVKVALHAGNNRVDILSASEVAVRPQGFDRRHGGDNVHGVYASLGGLAAGVVFEPHFLYRTRPQVVDERGLSGDADIHTTGFRLASNNERAWDFQTEMDWQFGTFGQDRQRAFLGLWGAGYRPPLRWKPRLLVEYTYASGDSEPGDGRIETFQQLYVRAHPILGIADLVGGRNIKALLTGVHLEPTPKARILIDHHFFWLASRRDGLYRHSGALLVPAPAGGASSAYVGHELDVQFLYRFSPYLTLGAGIGRLFSGAFLKEATPGASQTYPYVFLESQL